MNHKTGTREEWLAARLELLEAEKELTGGGVMSVEVVLRLSESVNPLPSFRQTFPI